VRTAVRQSACVRALMSLATAACLVGCGESSSPTAASRIAAPAAAPSVTPVIVGVAGDAAPSVAREADSRYGRSRAIAISQPPMSPTLPNGSHRIQASRRSRAMAS